MSTDDSEERGMGMDGAAKVRAQARQIISTLGLRFSPVGVRLLSDESEQAGGAKALRRHRYCQVVMRARQGDHVVLTEQELSCPAAAAAFGFRPLPEGLASGKGLVGFGIVSEEAVGRRMFEAMPRLQPGRVHQLHLFPLDEALHRPDVVLVEDEVEKLMWIALAYVNVTGGERVQSSTAVLQATCIDSTIIPYTENRLNLGYGCYGCRDATDLGPQETAMGFPGAMLSPITDYLEFLSQKAIPSSRSKRAWAVLQHR